MTKLEFHRLGAGKSRREMADLLNISESKYKLIEIGEQSATEEVVERVEKILEVKRDEVFTPQRYMANMANGVV